MGDVEICSRRLHALYVPLYDGNHAFWEPWNDCSICDGSCLIVAPISTVLWAYLYVS
jgi:hypothetical protein